MKDLSQKCEFLLRETAKNKEEIVHFKVFSEFFS